MGNDCESDLELGSRAAEEVLQWLKQVVIGLNLCPFASVPFREGRIRIICSVARSDFEILDDLKLEIDSLAANPDTFETTLLVLLRALSSFEDYNAFLDRVDKSLINWKCEEDFQIATFHPHYQFAGTHEQDASNLTNRSPWPILHILRESSVTKAVDTFPDPDAIPLRNIEKMNALTEAERHVLFPWVYRAGSQN